MEVSDAFLVLIDTKLEVAIFESCVSEVFKVACDFEDFIASPLLVFGLLVFGVVFVGVACCVNRLLESFSVVVAGELAAV